MCVAAARMLMLFSYLRRREAPSVPSHHLMLQHALAGFPDPASSPKSQLPYLQRGRQRIGDSNFIIQHLVRSGGPGGGGGLGGRWVQLAADVCARLCGLPCKQDCSQEPRVRLLLLPLAAPARVRLPRRCCTPPTQQQPQRPWQSPACATRIWLLPSFTSDG